MNNLLQSAHMIRNNYCNISEINNQHYCSYRQPCSTYWLLHSLSKICMGARERFFGWGSKNWWKTIKTIKLKVWLIMQYVFFEKKVYAVYNEVWGKAPCRSWGIFENFCVKSKLTSVRLLLTASYKKIGGAGCTSCSPNNFVGGAVVGGATAPLLPRFPRNGIKAVELQVNSLAVTLRYFWSALFN